MMEDQTSVLCDGGTTKCSDVAPNAYPCLSFMFHPFQAAGAFARSQNERTVSFVQGTASNRVNSLFAK